MTPSGWVVATHRNGWKGSYPYFGNQLESAVECPPLLFDMSLELFLFDFLEELVCVDNHQIIIELIETTVSGLGHILSKMPDKAIADSKK